MEKEDDDVDIGDGNTETSASRRLLPHGLSYARSSLRPFCDRALARDSGGFGSGMEGGMGKVVKCSSS